MSECEQEKKTFNTKLYVRILPTTDVCRDSIKLETNRQVFYVRCLQDFTKGTQAKTSPNYWSFHTDGVFWNSSQSEVYESVASDWYEDILNGISGIILSYGQTGSGKTFTTSGLRFHYQNRGLILRILSQLYLEKEQRRDVTKFTFGMSYLEFLGESVKDLITDKPLQKIKDALEHPLPNEEWAWKQIFYAECRKSYSEESPYQGSNRGHSVLTFYIHGESLIDTDPVITHSKIHVVDMAGIGNFGTEFTWKDKFDVGQSNLSKSLMEQLIICLNGDTWKEKGHICPYKASKFLMFLHDTLQPSCLIRFIAHIYGNEVNLPVTLSTMKFGEKLKAIKPMKLKKIVESNQQLQMRNLERERLRLIEEAELNEMLKDSPGYSNLSQERLLQIKRAAKEFLSGDLENLTLFSFGQATVTLEVFRELYYKLSSEKDQMIKEAITTATEMLQNQYASEKNFITPSTVITNLQKMSRRKSRQQDSQLSFGASFRSIDSGQTNLGKSSPMIQQVGSVDRKGISIGPGKLSNNFEGNITKAFKKLKTRRSDSIILKACKSVAGRENSLNPPKNQSPEDTDFSLPQSISSRKSAWNNFCLENADMINDMKTNIENHEEAVKISKSKYAAALAEVTELREKIKDSKNELESCRHIRQIYGSEEFDENGNLLGGEMEKEFTESLAKKEEQLNISIENCHIAFVNLRSLIEELNEAKKALEDTFQDYCKTNYKIVFLPEQTTSDDRSEVSERESPCEFELKNQILIKLYSHFQQKLFNYLPRNKKKEWIKY